MTLYPTDVVGQPTGGKPITLHQLHQELLDAGVAHDGLGSDGQYIFVYDSNGYPTDFPTSDQATVDQAIAAHVAMRDVTDAEYATEFQDNRTGQLRKQEIRDIMNELLPKEQVPVGEVWTGSQRHE